MGGGGGEGKGGGEARGGEARGGEARGSGEGVGEGLGEEEGEGKVTPLPPAPDLPQQPPEESKRAALQTPMGLPAGGTHSAWVCVRAQQ